MKNLALSLGFAILGSSLFKNPVFADCISKYEEAMKGNNVALKSNRLGKVRIGSHVLQSSASGSAAGIVTCKKGCASPIELLPVAAFEGIGLAVGAGFALAVPLAQGREQNKGMLQIIESIKQARTYSKRESALQDPLKKIVSSVLIENPELTPIEIAHIIAKADENETFCRADVSKLRNLDHLLILE